MLNSLSISAFNALYYQREGAKRAPFLSNYDPYFYPLDAIGHWNRMYGKRGFVQYQCVIPDAGAYDGMRQLLQELSNSRRPSFLAVLKRFGPQGRGLLSFPMAGYTLALDLPIREQWLVRAAESNWTKLCCSTAGAFISPRMRAFPPSRSAPCIRAMPSGSRSRMRLIRNNRFSSSLSRRLGIGEAA